MVDQASQNCGELKNFIEIHELSDRNSDVYFRSLVSITTEANNIRNQEMKVRISFDNYGSYGQVVFVEDRIDPYLYPTVFEAKFLYMQHIDDEYLLIKGNHTRNAKIGEYSVKITPLGRCDE